MKTRTQIFLLTLVILLLAMSATVALVVVGIKTRAQEDMQEYRAEELEKARAKLKNLVDAAYAVIDSNYRNARDTAFLEKHYASRLRDILDVAGAVIHDEHAAAESGIRTETEAKQRAIEALRRTRYDRGTGYLWINDTGRPIPKMIMHPTVPELDGKVLDDPKFNCALGRQQNLFQAMVDVCLRDGEGVVDYVWPKPTADGLVPDVPKLSYVRLFEEWNWVVGTGIYIDDAFAEAVEKSKTDIRQIRYDGGTGYFWINDTGRPIPKMIMHPTLPELDGKVLDDPKFNCALGKGQNLFQAMVDVCLENGEGVVDYLWPKPTPEGLSDPVPKLSYVRLHEPLGWIIGTGVYVDSIDATIARKNEAVNRQINELVGRLLMVSLLIVLGAALVCSFGARSLTNPIRKLIGAMEKIRESGLKDQRVTPGGSQELRRLGHIFNEMLDAIQRAMHDLAETTAAKERIESELNIARDIQLSFLPKIVPPFPDRPELQIHALLESAREVGGDFYDFFLIDDRYFCFSVGDVSDKGVPASLFMAVTKTLLKAAVLAGAPPAEVMARVNRELAYDNDMCMFVTVFMGILDLQTGEVAYANAGHCPPVLRQKSGRTTYVETEGSAVIGVLTDAEYSTGSLRLEPGSVLVLYSDGVTEAMNPGGELFEEERLLAEVRDRPGAPVQDVVSRINRAVKTFSKDAPQSDDITILAIQFLGPEG